MVKPVIVRTIDDERPQDELCGGDLITALHTTLQAMTAPASVSLIVRDVHFEKAGRWVLLHVSATQGRKRHALTVRMPRARAESIRARLNGMLG